MVEIEEGNPTLNEKNRTVKGNTKIQPLKAKQ